jgi:formamidopyrimidine-DNA glycosylase
MPELPEVETVVRGLRGRLRRKRLRRPEIWRPEIIESDPGEFEQLTAERVVLDVARRGKWILLHLEADLTVLAHLRMTGRFALVEANAARGAHDHLQWPLAGTRRALRFSDMRRFGRFRLMNTSQVERYLADRGFGPEPFEVAEEEFARRLGQGVRPIKSALLDQRVVSGIGNIYADEILFAARIDPRTPVRRLGPQRRHRVYVGMREILRRAILAEGTSLVNFVSLEGRRGSFAAELAVFRRTGQPCPRCGTRVARVKLAGRSTHFCRRCQR